MSRLFTDTDCEMWYTDAEALGLEVIKMPYILDDEIYYYDFGKNTDFKKLNNRMREGATPRTSALNPNDYVEYFEPVLKAGEDILYVHFSDKMSGTFNYMKLAIDELKQKYPDRTIKTFDTKSICFGSGIQVMEAGRLKALGLSDDQIIEKLEEFSKHSCMYFVVDSLTHLKRGGRVSSATAIVGGLLNIKPILKINDDGEIVKVGTGKGLKRAISSIVLEMKENVLDVEKQVVYVLDADNEALGEWMKKEIETQISGAVVQRYPIGPVIGAHCGPGTVGVIYYGKKR